MERPQLISLTTKSDWLASRVNPSRVLAGMKRRSQLRLKRTPNFTQTKVKSKSLRNHQLIVLKYRQSRYTLELDDVKPLSKINYIQFKV